LHDRHVVDKLALVICEHAETRNELLKIGHSVYMSQRLIIPLLCAATVAFASSSSAPREVPEKAPTARNNKSAFASSFKVDVAHGVNFTLDVSNNTSRMAELRFPSGRTHDFVVLDETGKEVWRWSDGRMFTQGLQNKLVKSRQKAVFAERWERPNVHGRFTAVAILASENLPVQQRAEFELK
jgi:hypothetical protein